MPKVSVSVAANWEVQVNIDIKKAIEGLDYFDEGLQTALEDGIYEWLYELRKHALATKPWENRTGALTAAHEIIKIKDGYALEVDARKTSGKDYNYAYALEKGWLKEYKWLQPAVDSLESELEGYIEREIQKLVDALDKKYVTVRMIGKRDYTMLQYPAGTVDPITGKKIGGRFVRKL